MPDRIDKALFLLGLVSYLAGQIWIVSTGSMTKDEISIDAIHWLMLLGASLMLPLAARLPRSGLALIASPVLIVGCVLIVGMCVIDFVFWGLPDGAMRDSVARELINTPSVWKPFITYSGWFFTFGLGLVGLHYWSASRIGAVLVVIGGVVIGAWGIGSNPYGYAMMLAGFATCFWRERTKPLP